MKTLQKTLCILIMGLFAGVPICGAATPAEEVGVGATDTAAYFPLLRGQRVAVLANQTARVGDEHLVDLLYRCGIELTGIFSPEHGFRGTADAGEQVASSVDERTGIPIRSLYDGRTRRPSDEAMRSFDVLVVDMQDVGLRFYTYYISMLRMMDASAEFGRPVIVLDRPNPNGDKVEGDRPELVKFVENILIPQLGHIMETDTVRLVAVKPGGQRAEFSIDLHGRFMYHLQGYEGSACEKDIGPLERDLEEVYGIRLTDRQTVWSNPDRMAAMHHMETKVRRDS